MERPLIIIPNPYLTGGHQLKNAELFSKDGSAVVVNEHAALENPRILASEVQKLIDSPALRNRMSKKLYKRIKKTASVKIAELLIENIKSEKK